MLIRQFVCVHALSPFSHVQPFVTLCTVACQAPLSMGFSKQEYWSGFPCPSPGDLPDPGIKPVSLCLLHWQAGSLPLAPPGKPFGRLHTGKCLGGSPSTLDGGGECREAFLSFEKEIERILVKMLEGP